MQRLAKYGRKDVGYHLRIVWTEIEFARLLWVMSLKVFLCIALASQLFWIYQSLRVYVVKYRGFAPNMSRLVVSCFQAEKM